TTTCVATVEFPTYSEGLTHWQAVLTSENHVGCGTEIALNDPPPDPTAPYSVTVVYNCTDGRAQAAAR
ncbi:MAG TPA: hypothetical protein VKU41_14580, partial [Polyangiaceae bacterium]|nr:hypothetical protein [Polyangiaceae bacterium]